jgi:hypothetical protein
VVVFVIFLHCEFSEACAQNLVDTKSSTNTTTPISEYLSSTPKSSELQYTVIMSPPAFVYVKGSLTIKGAIVQARIRAEEGGIVRLSPKPITAPALNQRVSPKGFSGTGRPNYELPQTLIVQPPPNDYCILQPNTSIANPNSCPPLCVLAHQTIQYYKHQ